MENIWSALSAAIGLVTLASSIIIGVMTKEKINNKPAKAAIFVLCAFLSVFGLWRIILFIGGRIDFPPPSSTPVISTPKPTDSTERPSSKDLDEINSKISYPKEDSYLETYKYGVIDAPKGDGVYGYYHSKKPANGDKIYFYPDHGERVTVLAHENYRICVIVHDDEGRACWINEDYIIYD